MAKKAHEYYTLIIVEDEKPIRQGLEHFPWNKVGFVCAGSAMNANQAISLATRIKPNVVLSDIKMPGLSGIDLAAQLRSTHPATKVVLISGHKDFEFAQRAIHEAVYEYILKPIDQKILEQVFVRLRTHLDEINHPVMNQDSGITEDRQAQLTQLLSTTDPSIPGVLAVTKAVNYLQDNYATQLTLDEVAHLVGLNSTYFSERFKAIAGVNYIDFLTKLRMENAKKLLQDPVFRVQDIAIRVGFLDPKYFTLAFKRYTGLSPLAYRKSILGKQE